MNLSIGFLNSEYNDAQSVLLHIPLPEIEHIQVPSQMMHLEKIKYSKIKKEFESIIECFQSNGIQVNLIPLNEQVSLTGKFFNLMYARDLLFLTPVGAIVSSMKFPVRYGEPSLAEETITKLDIPIIGKVTGDGTFEGADGLWLNPKLVIIGVGGRTNDEGFRQVSEILQNQGVNTLKVEVPSTIQHLLGVMQFIDHDMVLLRSQLVSKEVIMILQEHGITIIDVLESEEVTYKKAMNVVTIAPRTIVMPADCPSTKRFYQKHDISIVEVEISELRKGAGGLGCATSILSRKLK
ncbi:arginine deiminase family protein [Paenibacillus amylolyticus]|nr:arginine deiminase family protein [Paenibacillus amylolyticus]WFR61353.1 arginine deiminase family protein [Paenibacillus amylolyticus]